ncbi:pentapeptide repeat-containing protein [Streptomyces chartreusis]
MNDTDRDAYLATLTPGADIDHRATPFTEHLLEALLRALHDPTIQGPRMGDAVFTRAQFSGAAQFDGVQFSRTAVFVRAQFSDITSFRKAQFSGATSFRKAQFFGAAQFDGAQFSRTAWFKETQFSDTASFGEAQFSGVARFTGAGFLDTAGFGGAQFSRAALFDGAQFSNTAGFDGAQFSDTAWFDEAQFSRTAGFDEAQFSNTAGFEAVQFSGDSLFRRAQFSGDSRFNRAQFSGASHFDGAQFSDEGRFNEAQFSDDSSFEGAQFSGTAWFMRAQFSGDARFSGAKFSDMAAFHDALFSGEAKFDGALFSYRARFNDAQFSGHAWFTDAQFSGSANFRGVQFSGFAEFGRAQFSYSAEFPWVQFLHGGQFYEAKFSDLAWFNGAQFSGDAGFSGAQFSGEVWFSGVQFSGDAELTGARFAVMSSFGPVVSAGAVDLSDAVFETRVVLEIAAHFLHCKRTRWESTANLRLRYATVDLDHAALSFPMAVSAHPVSFTTAIGETADENLLAGSDDRVRLVSVQGMDAALLVLTDTDLSDCLFSGAFHLDQLRLEGRCTFAPTPTGLHRRHRVWPYRWTSRRTLAEEHHWRAQTAGQPDPPPDQGHSLRHWRNGPHHHDPGLTPDPEDVVVLYRQLRKAFEDGKNEPGAADFYYGEMEMRRHDRTGTPASERGLLWGYWLLSGYGLRASRALGWLLTAMAATIVLMMGLGLPNSSQSQGAARSSPTGGGQMTLTVDAHDSQLTLPTQDRFTAERFNKALQVVLNSVVFRSSSQNLTTWGTYTEMASRVAEPVLLALAVLAVRSRIKR